MKYFRNNHCQFQQAVGGGKPSIQTTTVDIRVEAHRKARSIVEMPLIRLDARGLEVRLLRTACIIKVKKSQSFPLS